MSDIFEIIHKDAAGRIGRLETAHGIVETPTIMPVINPNIQTIKAPELKRIGADMVITNSYIIYRKPEMRELALTGGLHSLIDFDGPIMTDSGSFQLSVYGSVEITNREILEFQMGIGTDIGVPLDIPTAPDVTREQAESELITTNQRIKEAREIVPQDCGMLLAAPVQGSTYPDLRKRSAQELSAVGFDVYPLGAVVPLMENYRYSDLVDVIVNSKMGLPSNAPVHLFGAGHPMMFALAVALGCDLFDSAAYVLYAKAGRYLTDRGTYHLDNLQYLPCSCPVCSSHTAQELKTSSPEEKLRLLSEHNLYATFTEMNLVKQCLREGNLWELVEQRCRSHPSMLDALKQVVSYSGWIEQYEPAVKSTYFYLGPESAKRVEVVRYSNRLDRFNLTGKVLIRDKKRKNEQEYDHVLVFKPPFGAYPVELDEIYPAGQAEICRKMDAEAISTALENLLKLIKLNTDVDFDIDCVYYKDTFAKLDAPSYSAEILECNNVNIAKIDD